VWQAGTHFGTARSNEPGALAWAELLTPEPQAAVGFFQQLFGHEVTEYPQDDGGTYTTLVVNGTEVAGIAPLAAEDDGTDGTGTGRAQWQVYFGVSDVAGAVDAAVAAGAVVLVEPADGEPADGEPEDGEPEDGEEAEDGEEPADGEPEDGEEAGIIATLQDPQGGVFSLVQV
jgi:hypothetical protein